jgi:hypothetical protein
MRAARAARLVQQLRIQLVPDLRDLAVLDTAQHRALRLGQVAAVVVLAAAQEGLELDEGAFQHAFGQVVQAEFLEARRVDDLAAAIRPGKRYRRVKVVVCLPVSSAAEISRTAMSASGTSRLISEDLPMPDWPMKIEDWPGQQRHQGGDRLRAVRAETSCSG